MNIRPALARLLFCSLFAISAASGAAEKVTVKTQPLKVQELASGSALLVDLKTNEVIYSSNPDKVVPIASVTKLMTAMVTLDAKLPMDEVLPVQIQDVKEMRGVFSRVKVGSLATRHEMLLLALMSSENRMAASLAHHYPGGVPAFVAAMNNKAKALGMAHTRYVEPTGLSELNVSSANDLVKLLKASQQYPLLGQLSTTQETTASFKKPNYSLGFRNTNHLIYKANWSIQLTKTGFTNEAGHCLVMRTMMNGRPVAFVVLDAFGKYTHIADAGRLKTWVETGRVSPVSAQALAYKRSKQGGASVGGGVTTLFAKIPSSQRRLGPRILDGTKYRV